MHFKQKIFNPYHVSSYFITRSRKLEIDVIRIKLQMETNGQALHMQKYVLFSMLINSILFSSIAIDRRIIWVIIHSKKNWISFFIEDLHRQWRPQHHRDQHSACTPDLPLCPLDALNRLRPHMSSYGNLRWRPYHRSVLKLVILQHVLLHIQFLLRQLLWASFHQQQRHSATVVISWYVRSYTYQLQISSTFVFIRWYFLEFVRRISRISQEWIKPLS